MRHVQTKVYRSNGFGYTETELEKSINTETVELEKNGAEIINVSVNLYDARNTRFMFSITFKPLK